MCLGLAELENVHLHFVYHEKVFVVIRAQGRMACPEVGLTRHVGQAVLNDSLH